MYEIVYGDRVLQKPRRWMLRPEQERLVLMNDIVCKFSRTGQPRLHEYAGTLTIAEECILLNQHGLFLAYEKDFDCLQNCTPELVEVYAS